MSCYFDDTIDGYLFPNNVKIECGGNYTKLESLYSYHSELYGCANAVDLLLLRGKGELINWSNNSQVSRVNCQDICENHLKPLLLSWNDTCPSTKKTKHLKQSFCSLPFIQHFHQNKRKKNVKTNTRIRKEEAISFMRAFRLIVHPGTLICSHHLELLRKKLDQIEFKYEVLSKGGHLSNSMEFWGELSDHNIKKKEHKVAQAETDSEDSNEEKKFRCTEGSCVMKYLTLTGLQNHLLVGKHTEIKHSDTVVEAAAKLFSECVETNETAYISMKTDSLSSSQSKVVSLQLKEGWAIRVKNGIIPIDPAVRRVVRKYFVERRKQGKRAEAKVVVPMLRNMTNPDGSYVFLLKDCLKETQAQGLISRFLKVEGSKMGLKALESDEENEMDATEDAEPAALKDISLQETMPKKRGRPKKIETTAVKPSPIVMEKRGHKSKKSQSITIDTSNNAGGLLKKEQTKPATRVLRERKRRHGAEEKMSYCEISSDEELDGYSQMMNALLEDETSDEE